MSDIELGELSIREGLEFLGTRFEEIVPDKTKQDAISAFLDSELELVISQRGDLETKWAQWTRHRLGVPDEEQKSYPWAGASNTVPPLAVSNTNTLYALLKNKYSRRKPFIEVETTRKDHEDHARALTKLINILLESPTHINFRKSNATLLYELISMGTQFVKVPWITEKWQFKKQGQTVDKIKYEGPSVIPIPIQDFYTRMQWADPQKMPWYAVRTRYLKHEILQNVANGIFEEDVVKEMLGQTATEVSDVGETSREALGVTTEVDTDVNAEYDIYEVNLFWDIDDDGIPEDLILFYHKDSGAILRAEMNELGIRDIVRIPYIEVPWNLYGVGVGWLSASLQEEITTLHNMRINSAHLSSLQMFKQRRGQKPIQIELRPLGTLWCDDTSQDYIPVIFPDVTQSTTVAESIAQQYNELAVGAGNALRGMANNITKSRTTASGEYLQVQQSTSIHDAITENLEKGYGQIALLILFQLIAHPERSEYFLPLLEDTEQQLVREILNTELTDIPSAFTFTIKTTDIDQTEEAKRQKILTMMQLYQMYTDRIIGYSMQVYNPQAQLPPELMATLGKFIVGQTKLMEEALTVFGETKPEDFVIFTKDIEMALSQQETEKNAQLGSQPMAQLNGGPPVGLAGEQDIPIV